MKIYTIGFTKKSAETFFNLLRENKVKSLLDVRLNNKSQLAGFTKGNDLRFFLKELCNIEYIHDISLSPTENILSDYKKKNISWREYEQAFNELLETRNVEHGLIQRYIDKLDGICILCSEPTAEQCHRRLVAEFIEKNAPHKDLEIVHL